MKFKLSTIAGLAVVGLTSLGPVAYADNSAGGQSSQTGTGLVIAKRLPAGAVDFQSTLGYHMSIPSGFQASAEEPGKDIIIDLNRTTDFMRVEAIAANASMTSVRQNSVAMLKGYGHVKSVNLKTFGSLRTHVIFAFQVEGKTGRQVVLGFKIKGFAYRIFINVQQVRNSSLQPYFTMLSTMAPSSAGGTGQTGGGTGIAAGTLQNAIIDNGTNQNGERVFTLTLKNQTEQEQDVYFNTSERYDYVLSKDGVVISRYSMGKMWGQSAIIMHLKQGEILTYDIPISGLQSGHYHLEAWVTCTGNNMGPHASIDFTVQ